MLTPKKNETFEQTLQSKDKAYSLFYATWCPYSQAFLPIFNKYAKANPQECLSVIADEKPDICNIPNRILPHSNSIQKRKSKQMS